METPTDPAAKRQQRAELDALLAAKEISVPAYRRQIKRLGLEAPAAEGLPVNRGPGRPVGTTQEVTLDTVLPRIRCRSVDLAGWQARAEADGVPFAEWCRRQLNR